MPIETYNIYRSKWTLNSVNYVSYTPITNGFCADISGVLDDLVLPKTANLFGIDQFIHVLCFLLF